MNLLNLDQELEEFYIDYINEELYRFRASQKASSYVPKITFVNKLDRTLYWFPYDVNIMVTKKKEKKGLALYPKLKYKPFNSTFSYSGLPNLDILRLYAVSTYGQQLDSSIESGEFKLFLGLVNEHVRKQELKKMLPVVKDNRFNVWRKPVLTNRAIYLRYFYDFSPHRVISRLRKFNFLSVTNWWVNKDWLFVFPKMKSKWLLWAKVEHFQFRFIRFEGMSYEYWVEQQLQYKYYNSNSFDLLTDISNSETFSIQYPVVTNSEIKSILSSSKGNFLQFLFFFWLVKGSASESYLSQPSYSAFFHPVHQYTAGAKYNYLKNYYSYFTPKYAQAYYAKYRADNFGLVYKRLRWYMFLMKPSYWNLKNGLDLHPHEFWSWEDVSWWEDHVPFRFQRFNKKGRRARFNDRQGITNWFGDYNLDAAWLYRSWMHENIALELTASFYKKYFNFQYLAPNSRFQSELPKHRKGHFDPKWQDRLFEYTYHRHPDYFFPSTKRFYVYYADGVYFSGKVDRLDSFIMLNYSWKINKSLLFFSSRTKKKLRLNMGFGDSLQHFRLNFRSRWDMYKPHNFFPVLAAKEWVLLKDLAAICDSLSFLINFFSKSDSVLSLSRVNLVFAFKCLEHFGILVESRVKVDVILDMFIGKTYKDLYLFVLSSFNVSDYDLSAQKERMIVEYIAFKRLYAMLVSEYSNR